MISTQQKQINFNQQNTQIFGLTNKRFLKLMALTLATQTASTHSIGNRTLRDSSKNLLRNMGSFSENSTTLNSTLPDLNSTQPIASEHNISPPFQGVTCNNDTACGPNGNCDVIAISNSSDIEGVCECNEGYTPTNSTEQPCEPQPKSKAAIIGGVIGSVAFIALLAYAAKDNPLLFTTLLFSMNQNN
jgi:hypothetical protein